MTLLFYAWFRPLVIVVSSLWSSIRPLFAPLYKVGAQMLPYVTKWLSLVTKCLTPALKIFENIANWVSLRFAVRWPRAVGIDGTSASVCCSVFRKAVKL